MRDSRPTSAAVTALVALAATVALTACTEADGSDTTTPDAELTGEVLVSAAASLTDAFGAVEAAFEQAHPGTDVVLNLGGSSTLREQVLEGAPVDVFASADRRTMAAIVDAGLAAGEPAVFATNRLQIAVPAGNPADVTGLGDFADASLFLGLCAAEVPCGVYARQALDAAGVTPSLDTAEPDVRALLTKIGQGELDAGITYVTDVVAAGEGVAGIEIPAASNVTAEYPIATLVDAPNPDVAAAFLAFVLAEEGQSLLAEHGFSSP